MTLDSCDRFPAEKTQIMTSGDEKSISCHRMPNMLVISDRNWTQWPSKPVQGLNRTWGERPINQPQLLYY